MIYTLEKMEYGSMQGSGIPQGIDSSSILAENMDESEKECLIYLPLYDEITHLEIGVSKKSYLKKMDNPFKGKIIVYGSSITQEHLPVDLGWLTRLNYHVVVDISLLIWG